MKFITSATFHAASKNSVSFLTDQKIILEVSVLEEKILRVCLRTQWGIDRTWSIAPGKAGLPYEGRPRDSLDGFSLPAFKLQKEKDFTEILTSALKLRIHHSPLRLIWIDQKTGLELHSDRKELSVAIKDKGWKHFSTRDEEDFYFGLGEKTGSLLRNERRFEMRNVDAMDYHPDLTDPLYKNIPFYICQKPKAAYGIFYDNLSTSTFDFGCERENYFGFFTSVQATAGDLDYYFILGPELKQVTKTFSWMTGKTFFAPLESIRYSGSTMAYTEGNNAQNSISQFLSQCEQHQIPVGSFQLSSGYCLHENLRHVFVWNKEKFPDFSKLVTLAKKNGVEFSANIKPVLFKQHPEYDEGLLIESGGAPESSYFWDGFASHLDFSKEKTRSWWKKKINSELLEKGITSTWNDNNEFNIGDENASLTGFEKTLPVSQLRPVLSLLMCQTSYDAQLDFNNRRRPWLITRAGGPGMQRYAQTWTGDNRTSWRSLKMNLQTALGLSLSGIYNWGIDVGGFSGPVPEPELFLRWIQQGIFYPRFTIHSWKADGTVTEPWMYPEILPLVKTAMSLREELMPYLYHQFYLAHMIQEPIVRPLIWDKVNERTLSFADQFFLGDRLLVCPVTEKGDKALSIYLPEHVGGWWNYFTDHWYAGDQVISLQVELSSIFLFVKGNSALPVMRSKNLSLAFYPSPVSITEPWDFFTDDGQSFSYLTGKHFSLIGSITSTEGAGMQLNVTKTGDEHRKFLILSKVSVETTGIS